LTASSTRPAVLLVHGYGCNSGYWHRMSRRLQAEGISHRAVELTPAFGGIDDMLPAIARGIAQLCAETGRGRIVVLAHSMGGLAMRAYLCGHDDDRIEKVITLGTPHHGTRVARLGIGLNSMQMRRVGDGADARPCDWIDALCAQETMLVRRRFVSIYSHHDNIVVPQMSSHLPGARNLALAGIGHVELGMHRTVQDLVLREILAPVGT
jgi:triacylglycerol esterase/lipase EstA (alpha/beta hydrolase family)